MAILAEHHPTGYPEPELRLFLSRNGWRVVEVPVSDRAAAERDDVADRRAATAAGARVLLAMIVVPLRGRVGRPAVTDRVQVVVAGRQRAPAARRPRAGPPPQADGGILVPVDPVRPGAGDSCPFGGRSLDASARWLGVYYPPAVLLMVLILMVFVASLCFSVIVSRQRQQIERLIEETAILAAELRELRRGDLRSRETAAAEPDRDLAAERRGA